MPASRQVVTRSPKRNVGLINCPWFQDRPIEHESRLEKHFVLRAMLFPSVQRIQHQPFSLELAEHGHRYTPDFLLIFDTGERLVVEVKRSERIKNLIDRFDEITRLCRQKGLSFCVAHEKQIEPDRIAQRSSLVRRYAMHRCSPELVARTLAHLDTCPDGQTIGELKKALSITQEEVLALIGRRQVFINKEVRIHDDGQVFAIKKESSNAAIQFGSWFGCAPWRASSGVSQPHSGKSDSASRSADTHGAGNEHQDLLLRTLAQEDSARDWGGSVWSARFVGLEDANFYR
jgi:hypothetical protein